MLTRGRTTRRTARLKIALSEHLSPALNDARPVATVDRLRAVLATAALNAAQEKTLYHIGRSTDRVLGVHGVAGAGKSMLVRSLVAAAEDGTHFIALALSSSAAANLGQTAARYRSHERDRYEREKRLLEHRVSPALGYAERVRSLIEAAPSARGAIIGEWLRAIEKDVSTASQYPFRDGATFIAACGPGVAPDRNRSQGIRCRLRSRSRHCSGTRGTCPSIR
ncbi:hypothetical protein GCM10009087_48700 [Sphingomonas oligophenolica]|uniref:AAA family ATPase n=1 Tax=Sphingomonas oligophenolica TaxID=301154 RepID=A0ABU9YBR3_9SPHN